MSDETPSIPGWYLKFQSAVLQNLPRPPQLSEKVALQWAANGGDLRDRLLDIILGYPKEVDFGPGGEKLIWPVQKLGLSARALNPLLRRNVKWVGQLVQIPEDELARFLGLGRGGQREIREVLRSHSLRLGLKVNPELYPLAKAYLDEVW